MPIRISSQPIHELPCDAVVCPVDGKLRPVEKVGRQILKTEKRKTLLSNQESYLDVGDTTIVPADHLACKHIIGLSVPVDLDMPATVSYCYQSVLETALQNQIETIAIPVIPLGTRSFEKELALQTALESISHFLQQQEMTVHILVPDSKSCYIDTSLYSELSALLDKRRCEELTDLDAEDFLYYDDYDDDFYCEFEPDEGTDEAPVIRITLQESLSDFPAKDPWEAGLEDKLRALDKGFAETLFDYIDAKGMTDVECYKRANIDRKTFSKIKCSKDYRPSKATVLAFAIALRLDIEETNHLLNTVGMVLSGSSKFDVIIEYFILNQRYDIHEINAALFRFDQVLLGC